MSKQILSANYLLKNIYTAKQCTDINDCVLAIRSLNKLLAQPKFNGAWCLHNRLFQLNARKKFFESKEK